jgi:glycosyltransferase involved in cell wall biosynthesis
VRICLISVEIFAWGKYGGFGRATRIIGRELARRGHEVFAVVPRRPGQEAVEQLDGMTVLGFAPAWPWAAGRLFRQCDADLYHSCEPSFGTYLAMRAMPERAHLVTVRDPRGWRDWRLEFALPSLNRLQVVHNFLYETQPLVRRAVRRADGVYTTARSLVPKVQSIYRLRREPGFLPTPVEISPPVEKSPTPTVCYMARLDRRKRPTLFFELAKRFPDVRFIAAGQARDPAWEAGLRRTYGGLRNLELAGFVDQFSSTRHAEILGQSWVMVNTAAREGLPNAFLEAAAHRCAILSSVDPDAFASQFGYHARHDDFERGLQFLLERDRWRAHGQRGHDHIRQTFEIERAIDQHLAVYEALVASAPSSRAQRPILPAGRRSG